MNDTAQTAVDGPFQRYRARVDDLFGSPCRESNAQALRASAANPEASSRNIHALIKALRVEWWLNPATRMDANWVWRADHRQFSSTKQEVSLERRLVEAAGLANWPYQMSTISGLIDTRSNKRHAVDLVQRVAEEPYELIELKINSDNPVFAAFEILGYGLAYCLARQHAVSRSLPAQGRPKVLVARRINLVVLAPNKFYQYAVRGNGPPRAYDLVWLTQSLNGGLASLPHELGLSDLEPMRLSFRAYFDEGQLLMDVAAGKTAGSPIS